MGPDRGAAVRTVLLLGRMGERDPGPPRPAERAIADRLAGPRREEFRAARALAHRALERLGTPAPAGIGAAPDGAPSWPAGVTGSITHSGGLIAVVVGRRDAERPGAHAGLGIDLERVDAVPAEVIAGLTAPGELRAACAALGEPLGSPLARVLLHCAKEAAFKAGAAPVPAPALGGWDPRALRVDVFPAGRAHGGFAVCAGERGRDASGIWWRSADTLYALAEAGSAR